MQDKVSNEDLEMMIHCPLSYLLNYKGVTDPHGMADAYGELAEALKEERKQKNLFIEALLSITNPSAILNMPLHLINEDENVA